MRALTYAGAALALFFGLVSIYLLLPKVRERPALPSWLAFLETGIRGAFSFLDKHRLKIGLPAGVLALVLAGGTLLTGDVRSAENVLFYLFAAIAIVGGVLLITQTNPARAALSFVLVVLSTCGLFLLLGAPFLMAGTVIIYAGAIVVTFLFVLMLAQQDGPSDADNRSREPLLACIAGFVLLGGLLYLIHATYGTDELDRLLDRSARLETQITEMNAHLDANPPLEDLVRQATAITTEAEPLKVGLENWDAAHPTGFAVPTDTPKARLHTAIEAFGSQRSILLGKVTKDQRSASEIQTSLGKFAVALADVRREGLLARSALGQLVPHGELSELSGPVASLPRDQRRVDDKDQPQLPAENVAYLGRSLFSDYLVPVGAAGVLLLVATIGAIAIAMRQRDDVSSRTGGRAP